MSVLVDAGPLIALFDPADPFHRDCLARLNRIGEPMLTTLPVLTEAFHMLRPASRGADNLRLFIGDDRVLIHFHEDIEVRRAFELMETYRDLPMDFADASIVAAAEAVKTKKAFTLDRRDFSVYRVRLGRRHYAVEIV